ncbi:MAG: transketolase family protein, partial [Clostridia bacterium]|nr:transketolase family protein [Clostridia bacterium]
MSIIYDGTMQAHAFKDVFGEVLPALCQQDPDVIYLDADLMSCIGTAKFAKAHPERAINCGIAESNMVGVACGLAAAGFKPIVHTFGPFASRRCFDQVFLSAGYAKNDITVIGTDPGVTAMFNGGTHMPFEDIALY